MSRVALSSLNSVSVVDATMLRRRRRNPQQEIKKVKKDAMEKLKDPLMNSRQRLEENLSPDAREKLLAVLRADNTRRMRARFGDSWDSWDEPPVETPMDSARPRGVGRPDVVEAEEVQRVQHTNFLEFEKARAHVWEVALEGTEQWEQWCRDGHLPANIPSQPDETYADKGWVSWADWLEARGRQGAGRT